MRKSPSLSMQKDWPIIYDWLPLQLFLQQGTKTHFSAQGEAARPHCPNNHYQHEPKHRGGHHGRPNCMPGHPSGCISLYAPELPPPVIRNGTRWTALSAGAGAALTSHGLTETAVPNTDTPAAIGDQQKKSNHARPTGGPTATPRQPVNTDSDAM